MSTLVTPAIFRVALTALLVDLFTKMEAADKQDPVIDHVEIIWRRCPEEEWEKGARRTPLPGCLAYHSVDDPESNLVVNNPLSRFLYSSPSFIFFSIIPSAPELQYGGPRGQTTAFDNALDNTVVECDG